MVIARADRRHLAGDELSLIGGTSMAPSERGRHMDLVGRHWGLLIFGVGVLLIYAAFHTAVRRLPPPQRQRRQIRQLT
jgi:hypothetical protein